MKSFIIIEGLGGFKATLFAGLIFGTFEEGFSKEIDHLSHPGFLNFRNFETRFELKGDSKSSDRVSDRAAQNFFGTGF